MGISINKPYVKLYELDDNGDYLLDDKGKKIVSNPIDGKYQSRTFLGFAPSDNGEEVPIFMKNRQELKALQKPKGNNRKHGRGRKFVTVPTYPQDVVNELIDLGHTDFSKLKVRDVCKAHQIHRLKYRKISYKKKIA